MSIDYDVNNLEISKNKKSVSGLPAARFNNRFKHLAPQLISQLRLTSIYCF